MLNTQGMGVYMYVVGEVNTGPTKFPIAVSHLQARVRIPVRFACLIGQGSRMILGSDPRPDP
jgi:hypothetical protein